MDLKKTADKAKGLFNKNRAKVEDAAEKGIKTFEDKTGKKVPDAVKDKVDQIDPSDNAALPKVENAPKADDTKA